MARILLVFVLPAALMIYALVDCVQDDEVDRTAVPKPLWVLLIVLIFPYIGPLAWLIVAKVAKPRQNRRPSRRQPTRPLAPDDDPDFLRHLADEQLRRERQRDTEGDQTDA